jgi:DNA-binding transcriptional MerR regulator
MLEVEVNFKSRIICREFGVTIGEVAAKATIATSAIRYYERSGLLKQPLRKNVRRVYSDDVLHELVIIEFAKETGFTLSETKLLLHGFPENTAASARLEENGPRENPRTGRRACQNESDAGHAGGDDFMPLPQARAVRAGPGKKSSMLALERQP